MKTFLIVALSFCIGFSAAAQTAPEPTETVLNNAYAKAAKENKKVILIFHASWCGWCHKMEASINDPSCSKFFSDNYVIAYLDVQENADKKSLENPGGNELMKKYDADQAGLPFWLILDARGSTLSNSLMKPDGTASAAATDNVGCPATEKEVDYFAKLLKSTSKLNDSDLAIIKARFRKNDVAKPTTGTN